MARTYPETYEIENSTYGVDRILKDDFFSVNVVYKNNLGNEYVLKLSDFRFVFGFILRPFASFMSKREYEIYEMLAGVPGIPKLGPRLGNRGYFHEFIPGRTLHELAHPCAELPEDFFIKLKATFDELHKRRICHIDTNKRGNIIFGDDGQPYLIDFQISLLIREQKGILAKWSEEIFETLKREELYQLYKHKKRYQPKLLTPEEEMMTARSKFNKLYNKFIGNPYKSVKRLIYPSGSNETIWYKWNKERKGKLMP